MSTEFIILVAAFLLMMGWFLDALREEENILVKTYVHLSDEKWRKLPQAIIDRTIKVFDRVLGPAMSLRSFGIIVVYSCVCNALILLQPTAKFAEILAFHSGERSECVIDNSGFFLASLICGACLAGAIHDIFSINATRWIIKRKFNLAARISIDLILAYFLLISTASILMTGSGTFYRFLAIEICPLEMDNEQIKSIRLFYATYDLYIYNINEAIDVTIYYMNSFGSMLNDIGGMIGFGHADVEKVGFFTASSTTLFPTFTYIGILFLAIAIRLVLEIAHSPASSFLNWVSKLPRRRIGIVTSGLSALIVLLQAIASYRS